MSIAREPDLTLPERIEKAKEVIAVYERRLREKEYLLNKALSRPESRVWSIPKQQAEYNQALENLAIVQFQYNQVRDGLRYKIMLIDGFNKISSNLALNTEGLISYETIEINNTDFTLPATENTIQTERQVLTPDLNHPNPWVVMVAGFMLTKLLK